MSAPGGPLLVLGIGNILLRDEGLGVHLVRELESRVERGQVDLPRDTWLLDGGTLGLDLLPQIADARAVLLIDAIDLRLSPGSIRVICGDALEGALTGHVSPHQAGVGDLIAAARLLGSLPEAVALVGIQPLEIAIGLELTGPVRAALPAAVEVVLEELDRLDRLAAAHGQVGIGAVATSVTG